jgi:uncharacterized protein
METRRKRGNPNWKKGGPSPNPSGKRKDSASAPASAAAGGELKIRLDSWYSALSGIGTSGDKRQSHAWSTCQPVTDVDAVELWRANDLAARVIETIPNEMIREGFDLKIREADEGGEAEVEGGEYGGEPAEPGADQGDEERVDTRGRRYRRDARGAWRHVDKARNRRAKAHRGRRYDAGERDLCDLIKSRWEELDVLGVLWKANCYERAYGGAAILLGADDGTTNYARELDLESIKSLDWLTVLEPRELTPRYYYSDPRAPKYGEVEVWTLNPISGGEAKPGSTQLTTSIEVHESRLIIFDGIQVTRRQITPLSGFGDSVLTRFFRVLRDFDLSFDAAAILMVDFAPAVLKIKGLAEIFATDSDEAFQAKMKQVEMSRSIARLAIVDSEEEFERKTVNVAGLPDLLDRMMTRCAAAADMPLTLLMGQSPAGLNATGESDIRFFYDRVQSQRARKVIRPLERITRLLMLVEGAEPEHWCIEGKPLWQPTQLEQAQARKAQMETDVGYVGAGILGATEVAVNRFREGGSFDTVVDFDSRELGEPPAESPAKTAQEQEQEQAEADQAAAELEIAAKKAEPKPAAKKDAFDPQAIDMQAFVDAVAETMLRLQNARGA